MHSLPATFDNVWNAPDMKIGVRLVLLNLIGCTDLLAQ